MDNHRKSISKQSNKASRKTFSLPVAAQHVVHKTESLLEDNNSLEEVPLDDKSRNVSSAKNGTKAVLDRSVLFDAFEERDYFPIERSITVIEAESFITELDFTGVEQLTDLYFWALNVKCGNSNVCKMLEKLTVQGCLYLTDDAVVQISKCFPSLKEIDLNGCLKLSEVSVWRLLRACSKLQVISMMASEVGIVSLPEPCSESVTLKLQGCPLIMPPYKVYKQENGSQSSILTRNSYFDELKKTADYGQHKVLIATPFNMKETSLLHYINTEGKDWIRPGIVVTRHIPKLLTSKGQNISLTLFDTAVANQLLVSLKTLFVIPFIAEADINHSSRNVLEMVCNLLTQVRVATFLIVGVGKDQQLSSVLDNLKANILKYIDSLKANVEKEIKNMTSLLNDQLLPHHFGKQKNLSNLIIMKKNLSKVRERISFIFINVSKPEQYKILLTSIGDSVLNLATLFPLYQRFSNEFLTIVSAVTSKNSIIMENKLIAELRQQFSQEFGFNLRTYKKCLEYMHMLGQIVYIPTKDEYEGVIFPNHDLFGMTINNIVKIFVPKNDLEPVEVNSGVHVIKTEILMEYLHSASESKMLEHVFHLLKASKGFLDCNNFIVLPLPLPAQPPVPLEHYLDDVNATNRLTIECSYTSLYQLNKSLIYSILISSSESVPNFVIWNGGIIAQAAPVVAFILVEDIEQAETKITVFRLLVQSLKPDANISPKCKRAEKQMNALMWKALMRQQSIVESFLQESQVVYQFNDYKSYGFSKEMDVPSFVHSVHFGHSYNSADVCTLCGQERSHVAAIRKMNVFCFPTMSSSLIMMANNEGNQKGCWFTTINEMEAKIQIYRYLSSEEFPLLRLVTLVNGPLLFGIEHKDNRLEYVDFELGTLPNGTKLQAHQYLAEGDILQLSMFWQGDNSICYISKNCEVLLSIVIEEENSVQPYVKMKGQTTVLMDVQYVPASSNVAVTWETGMRLEAIDRKNPHLCCVAYIEEISSDGLQVRIHFDGWTCLYDYWADTNSIDLHPLGWSNHNNKQLQAPRGQSHYYFNWDSYLQEIVQQPVPYALFTDEQKGGTPEFKLNKQTKEILLNAGKYFVFGKEQSNNKTLSIGLGYDRYCHSKYNAFSTFHNLLQKVKEINLAAFSNLDISQFLLPLPTPLNIENVIYFSCKAFSDFEHMQAHCLCPGTYKTDLHFLNTDSTRKIPFLPQLIVLYLDVLLDQIDFLPHPADRLIPKSKDVDCDFIKRSFRKMLVAYRAIIISEFTEWNLSMLSDIEIKPVAIPKSVMNYVPEFGFAVCGAHEASNSQNRRLVQLNPDRFLPYQHFITELNFANNNIGLLPQNLFSAFPALKILSLENNKISNIPSGMSKCVSLWSLSLKQNRLKDLPAELNLCTSLKNLNVSCNPFAVLPEVIFECVSLIELHIADIGFTNLSEKIGRLESLEVLDLSGNLLIDLPETMSNLKRLTHLDISGVAWIRVEDERNFSVITREAYNKIAANNILMENFNHEDSEFDFFGYADDDCTGVLTIEQTDQLNKAVYKKFHRIGQNNSDEQYGKCPSIVFTLTSLESLKMNFQAIKEIDERIALLTELKELSLTCCPELENVAPETGNLPNLESLYLQDCALLKTPPKEIVRAGFQAAIGYLRRLAQGSVECKRTKLMMVGLGGAGKTSLVESLTNGDLTTFSNPAEIITDGIKIKSWTVPTDEGDLTYKIWDFAGQSVYYNTHQFFLSNRAVYLLLWNIRLGHEHAGLEFWLSSIACHAPKAPVIIVGSHKDQVEKFWLPEGEMKKKYPQIKGFFAISCYTYEGITELKSKLIEISLAQKYMGEKIPEAWLVFENKLLRCYDDTGTPVLHWSQLEEKAMEAGIVEKREVMQAVRFLHDLGSIQHFQNEHLRKHVVINPQWIVDAMACIVSVHNNCIDEGWLYHKDVPVIWSNFDPSLHEWLLRLTEEFNLSFRLKDQPINIVPCLLTAEEPVVIAFVIFSIFKP